MKTQSTALTKLDAKEYAKRLQSEMTGAFVQAGKTYREYIDGAGDISELHALVPAWGQQQWGVLADLAYERIIPELVFLPNYKYAALRALPPGEQRKIINNGVQVWVVGDTELKAKSIQSLNKAQTEQVFAMDGVRSIAGQRLWVEGQKTAAVIRSAPAESALVQMEVDKEKHVLRVFPGTKTLELDRRQLLRILGEME